MQFFANLVLVVQLLSAIAIIGLVLVQQGKGADMGASFGSGASGSLFGATGSANFLSRSTAIAATLFFGCTLGLAFLSNGGVNTSSGSDTALERAPAAVAPAASGAAAIPGAIVAPAAPASAAASAAAN
ncbi:preprotein translocase subunit SecG [Roseateles asaccharophilus]|uniref:Protein-export membrane protein SecG n=1 Tax=Roseateles asaccharophilus TaxID=582607 RepID=A0ABU2AEK1_9BURK|nr:preprotein translocase subunit SecG [Roseateles asaccharophilus]MDR7334428.1 preprotein translocase subunit SecG [Roseateles asaccharophilus]